MATTAPYQEAPQQLPVECMEHFFHGVAAPRMTSMDFSLDGLHCISTHEDDALRWIDVVSLQHRETIRCAAAIGGVQYAAFTSSSDRMWLCPRGAADGHLYIYSASSEKVVSAIGLCDGQQAGQSDAAHRSYKALLSPGGALTNIAQSITTDTAAVVNAQYNSVQVVHPLVSGPVAATPPCTDGPLRRVSWSYDGILLAVAGAARTTVFDLRKLATGPVDRIDNQNVFPLSRSCDQDHATWCEGAQFNDSSNALLMTSRMGEAVAVSLRRRSDDTSSSSSSSTQRPTTIVASYLHGASRRHFMPSREDAANMYGGYQQQTSSSSSATTNAPAVPAQFVHPHAPGGSMVAQPAASLFSGRHLLIYECMAMDDTTIEHQRRLSFAAGDSASHQGGRLAALRYQVQFRENDLPRTMAINRRFGIVAVGAKSSTWFAVRPES